jgi:hypothetical protein
MCTGEAVRGQSDETFHATFPGYQIDLVLMHDGVVDVVDTIDTTMYVKVVHVAGLPISVELIQYASRPDVEPVWYQVRRGFTGNPYVIL